MAGFDRYSERQSFQIETLPALLIVALMMSSWSSLPIHVPLWHGHGSPEPFLHGSHGLCSRAWSHWKMRSFE